MDKHVKVNTIQFFKIKKLLKGILKPSRYQIKSFQQSNHIDVQDDNINFQI